MIAAIEGAALVVVVCSLPLIYFLYRTTYNIWFHPLANFPGSPWWTCSEILPAYHTIKGDLMAKQVKLHHEYGPVVRVGPNELSFTQAEAWQDIYSARRTRGGEMPKCTLVDSPLFGIRSILTAENSEHGRLRRIIAPAFTDRAVKVQENLVQRHIDVLMERLKQQARRKPPIDIGKWITFTVFDIIGDLTWGESFHCLEDSKNHSWIASIVANIKLIAYSSIILRLPFIPITFLMLLASRNTTAQSREHVTSTEQKVNSRLALGNPNQKPDFLSYTSKRTEGGTDGLSLLEIQTNSHIFIIAGSETTATALTGALYHLLRFPQSIERLQDEIRTHFIEDNLITYDAVTKLPYLTAVIQETLRIYPPVPGLLQRYVPDHGTNIAGQCIPGGTAVGVHHFAAYHSPENFRDPELFIPERWLNQEDAYGEESCPYIADHRDVLQPFSVGPRDCIGRRLAYMEMKLILARLVWGFNWRLIDGNLDDWVEQQQVFNLWDRKPLQIIFENAHVG